MRRERSSRRRPCADRERAERRQRHATELAHQFDRLEIHHFFEVNKALEPGKEVETATWVNQAAAYSEIEACRERARSTGDQDGHGAG
jgi:inorganic pyrophosphatase